jgi:hypothetical protein
MPMRKFLPNWPKRSEKSWREGQKRWTVFLFIDRPITWADGFDTEDGIRMARSVSTGGIREVGEGLHAKIAVDGKIGVLKNNTSL